MANNPYVNKVQKADGTTLIDLTSDTAVASDVAAGKYFHLATGERVAGTSSGGGGGVIISDTTDTHGGTIRTLTGTTISGTKSITSNGTGIDVASYAAVNVAVPQLDTSDANAVATDIRSGKSGYVNGSKVSGSVTSRSSSDLSASGATVTVPAGIYDSQATKSVASGTAGTPTASKGTVSNHQVSVTPSVTNTTGYITGSTKTGTAVTVTASELASGNKEITSNGTNIDVVGYSTVSVNVSGGGGKNVQYVMDKMSVRTNGYTSTGMSITVAKTGTYNVSWVGWRSSSQGSMGTNLYKNGNAGTNQTTFTNTYGQQIVLTNQSYNQGDVLTLYATAGSTTRYMWVANLIIEEQ